MATDTTLHFRELLITLDYLLNYASEDYPATQQAICRYSKEYGLHYEEEGHRDEIRRDRIGKCLEYLQYVTYKFKDKVPFVITTTDHGKYYIEEKNHLNDQQIIKVLAAVKNDKYTKEEDTDLLINRLLDSLANKRSRETYRTELEKEDKSVKKYNTSVNRKMKLVYKALNEKKSILIIKNHFTMFNSKKSVDRYTPIDPKKKMPFGTINEKLYCRVYRIEEHNNKPYAILVPLNQSGVIFDAIDNLSIPTALPERELLIEDEPDEDRFEKLFQLNNKRLLRFYSSLDEFIEKQIMPERGFSYKTSFYFNYKDLDKIQSSFEEYFAKGMPVIRCNKFNVKTEKTNHSKCMALPFKTDVYAIVCESMSGDQTPRYGVVNMTINKNAFINWIYSNPNVAMLVNVVAPIDVNAYLANHYLMLFQKYQNAISDENLKNYEVTIKDVRFKKEGH